jgi:hypothetical protein
MSSAFVIVFTVFAGAISAAFFVVLKELDRLTERISNIEYALLDEDTKEE